MSLVFVGLGFMAFLAATTLAIDVGMFMTARAQAQNSADAGALAGATALIMDDYDDRSTNSPVVQNALVASGENQVIHADVDIDPGDVTFPLGPTGLNNRVRVRVFRTGARGNPLATLVGGFFGVNSANMEAMATAEASPTNAQTCVKPFTIPDKWEEHQTPPWDPDDTFDVVDKKGNPLPNPDVYRPGSPRVGGTSYDWQYDRGEYMMIRAGTGNEINPSFYFSWEMPGGHGGDWYRENIAGCNTTIMHPGELMNPEPGNMVGPTSQGIDDLIAKDPYAYWDDVNDKPVSGNGTDARTIVIPLYDPVYYDTGKQNGRTADLRMANWLGFWVDRRAGNNVYGYVTPIIGIFDRGAGPAPAGLFPQVIRLVE